MLQVKTQKSKESTCDAYFPGSELTSRNMFLVLPVYLQISFFFTAV